MHTEAEPYPAVIWSAQLLIAISPERTFARLVANAAAAPARSVLARLAGVLFTIAIVVPVMAVQRVDASLVATAALSWSFVLVIQIAVAVGVILSSPTRRASLLHAVDLWFAGSLPYSVWMLIVAAIATNSRLVDPAFLFAAALVPAAWTAWIVAAFCRTVLNTDRKGARRRAAAHQVIVWTIALTYAALFSGGWSQVVNAARILR